MDGYEFKRIIENKKPRYSAKYKEFVEIISLKGDKSGRGNVSTFGAYYQTFMYAFIVGLRIGKKEYLSPDEEKVDFAPISNWKPSGVRDFILMTLMNRCKEFKTPWQWLSLEDATEENLNNFAIEVMRELEAYANVGLSYLKKKWDTERIMFNNPFVFIQILDDLEESLN